jgi:hypothetical protein
VVGRRALQQKSSDEVASNIRDIERNIKHRRGFKTWSQMAKYNRVKNESFDLTEGNPLARVKKHLDTGRHFSAISAERSHLSPAENKRRHGELQKAVRKLGYGYRKSEGRWEGGKERSLVVSAKKPGKRHGNKLKRDMIKLGKHFDQDSVMHHGKNANLHGTNKTGMPGEGRTKRLKKTQFNPPPSEFQTQFRRGKSFTNPFKESFDLTEGPVKAANKAKKNAYTDRLAGRKFSNYLSSQVKAAVNRHKLNRIVMFKKPVKGNLEYIKQRLSSMKTDEKRSLGRRALRSKMNDAL